MKPLTLILSILFISCGTSAEPAGPGPADGAPAAGYPEAAERSVVRLSPDEFADLPAEVAADLKKRGCTIPQSFGNKEKHNVIKGSFTERAGEDLAVLCSRGGSSAILVYRKGEAEPAATLAEAGDADFMQTIDEDGRTGFSRAIGPADADFIKRRHEEYGGPEPPELTHAGINDAFVEKASTVHYFDGRKWHQLTGDD